MQHGVPIPVRYRAAAIAAALFGVVGAMAWAPVDVIVLDPSNVHPTTVASLQDGDFTASRLLLMGMISTSRVLANLAIVLWGATLACLALFSLLLMSRRRLSPPIRDLAMSLAFASAAGAWLWVCPIVPWIQVLGQRSLPLTIALDVGAFLLWYAACRRSMAFWDGYPRHVSEQELWDFEVALWKRRGLLMRALGEMPLHTPPERPAGASITGPRLWGSVLVVAVLGLFWHLTPLTPGLGLAVTLSCIAALGFFVILGLPMGFVGRRLRFHMLAGSEEDRRKLGWLRTAMLLLFALYGLMLLGFGVLAIYGHAAFIELSPRFMASLLYVCLLSVILMAMLVGPMAMLYRGNLDPQLAIKGLTVWTVMGVVLTLLFALVERSIALKLGAWLGLPPQTGFVVAGAVIAATFQPIRKRVEKHVNRFVERVMPASMLASGTAHSGAVAIVDISGYTALAATDELAARLASTLLQKEARHFADQFAGRVVKNTGDGALMCFTEAKQALDAVAALHAAIAKSAQALNLAELKLHSGLHWGEFVELHDGDIYGQAVNLTARIADWAGAGEIGASEAFYLQLQPDSARFQATGPQRFKNVPEPINCLKLAADQG